MTEPANNVLAVRIDEHDRRLTNHETVHDEIWEAVNALRERLPTWAVLAISFLTGALGTCIGIIATVLWER